jgi:hypothetical protein
MLNIKARLEAQGSALDKVVWANWSLREPAEFVAFNKEWIRWFPGDAPVGQETLMPLLQRRAGFRISIGAIAEADAQLELSPQELDSVSAALSRDTRMALGTQSSPPPGGSGGTTWAARR